MEKSESFQSDAPVPSATLRGVQFFDGFLSSYEQSSMVSDLRGVVHQAPLFQPKTPAGKPMSVRLSAAGRFGWYSDAKGYRYVDRHPAGAPWPDIPQSVLAVWHRLAPGVPPPECCLINYYKEAAKMGLHQDKDEANFDWPVVSISLGDDALFRVGNLNRGGPTQSRWLRSGDVCVIDGAARLIYHGVDRIKFGTSTLLSQGGRINLTLRVVT